jgi:catechol 2,3-dioxygenase-like lactoylglutathione lyase family enzyme
MKRVLAARRRAASSLGEQDVRIQGNPMLSHVHIGITNFERSFAFYSRLMAALHFPLKFAEPSHPWAGWKPRDAERPLFLIGAPFNGELATSGNGQMIALMASTRNEVDECYAAAIDAGGVSEGSPGLRPHYHPNYYGAYFRDPDGNKICVCCHES